MSGFCGFCMSDPCRCDDRREGTVNDMATLLHTLLSEGRVPYTLQIRAMELLQRWTALRTTRTRGCTAPVSAAADAAVRGAYLFKTPDAAIYNSDESAKLVSVSGGLVMIGNPSFLRKYADEQGIRVVAEVTEPNVWPCGQRSTR